MANLLTWFLGLGAVQLTALTTVIFLVLAIGIRQKNTIIYPDNLPRLRENGRKRFSLKTRLAYYTDCQNMFREAYETYSKNGLTCLIPGVGFRDEVILPTSAMKWAAAQPDNVLSVYESFLEMDQAWYSAGGAHFVTDPWQGAIVRSQMNQVLETLCDAMNNELAFAFDQRFGTDEKEWKELNVYSTMKMIVAQASTRFTLGLPHCRNEEYLRASSAFCDQFVLTAGITSFMPKFLRPLVGNIAHIPQYLNLRTMQKNFSPILAERIALCRSTEKTSPDEPQDHLQMMVRYAITERPNELASPKQMTSRLAMANMGSFHQTSIAITNILFNILASDAEYNTIALLREEIESVVGSNGQWTKNLVSKLVKCDSVCKETMRLHAFGNRSLMRIVMVDNLKTPDGILLPKNSMVSLLATSQHDGSVFPDPLKFRPFRYSELREKEGATAAFVSLGERFLPFGYGRHACPGRFLLEFELKMILAYLVVNYDFELAVEHKGVRPESRWIAEAIMPPLEGKIRVRRRQS